MNKDMQRLSFLLLLLMTTSLAKAQYNEMTTYDIQGNCTPHLHHIVVSDDDQNDIDLDTVIMKNDRFRITGTYNRNYFLTIKAFYDDKQPYQMFKFVNDGKPIILDLTRMKLTGSSINNRLDSILNIFRLDEIDMRLLLAQYNDARFSKTLTQEERKSKMDEVYVKMSPYYKRQVKLWDKVYAENRDNILAPYFLTTGGLGYVENDPKKLVYAFRDAPYASHPILHQYRVHFLPNNHKKATREASIGKPFEDIDMLDQKHYLRRLSRIVKKGNYALIEFWKSTSDTCRTEAKELRELYDQYHGKGFTIVGFSFDMNRNNFLKFIEETGRTWINLSDNGGPDNVASKMYGVESVPDNMLVDENGIVVARGISISELKARLQTFYAPNRQQLVVEETVAAPMTHEEEAVNDSIIREGLNLYVYVATTQQAWAAFDESKASHPEWTAAKAIDFVTMPNDNGWHTVIYNRQNGQGYFDFVMDSKNESFKGIDKARMLTKEEREWVDWDNACGKTFTSMPDSIIQNKMDSMGAGRNFIWIPVKLSDNLMRIYFMPVTTKKEIPFGNDFSVDFDRKGSLIQYRIYHHGYKPFDMSDTTKVWFATMHRHEAGYPYITPTDICSALTAYHNTYGIRDMMVYSTDNKCSYIFICEPPVIIKIDGNIYNKLK